MKKAFTLVELLITIGIMAVLAAGTVSLIGPSSGQTGRDTQRRTDLAAIAGALGMYRNDEGQYPPCSGGAASCNATSITGISPTYIESIPTDPRFTVDGRFYRYQPVTATGGSCDGTSGSRCARFRLCAGSEKDDTASTECNFLNSSCLCGNDSTETCVFVERNQ